MQQQSVGPRVVFSTTVGSPQQSPAVPLVAHIDTLIKTLNEAPQDDVKYRALKEISETLEDLAGTPAYVSLVDSLIRVFIKLLQETTPQFIAENNTLQLRKLMLELLLRLSSNDLMKTYGKNLQQILLRMIYMENEENALLVIKILTDYIKTFRPPFTPELNAFFAQSKNAYNEMFAHTANEAMFLQRPFITTNKTIEESVVEALKTCYASTTLSYSQQQQAENYTLIPRASQSVKVLAEMSVFLLVLIQAHRQHLLAEVHELVPIFVRYLAITVPRYIREDKGYNRELVEEFHNSQVRALSFVAYTSRQTQMADMISANAKSISDGIINLFDSFHDELISQRRELLIAIKYFFQCEFRAQFIAIIPKMCNDATLLGTSFTSQDQLRNHAYSYLADILHHVRMNLDQKLLIQIFFIASRNLHDPQLMPYVQTMYGKLMMNLIEALVVQPKEHYQLHCQVLCSSIDSLVRKAKVIAEFHLPAISDKILRGGSQQQQTTDNSSNKQQKASSSNDTTEKGKKPSIDAEASKQHSLALEASQSYWQYSRQPLSLNDCKNMVRFIVQPVKMMLIALKDMGGLALKDMGGLDEENDLLLGLMSDFFRYGLRCLDIFMLANSIMAYPKLSSSNMRSKEEKDTIEAFVSTFTHIGDGIFEQIIERHIEFLVGRILVNPVLQNVCNSFFMHTQTMARIGTVLVKFLLSKLPELGIANNEKSALHLKLFKLVFQAVSFTHGGNSDCQNILKPFLHKIVRDSMQLAISARESTNYFMLLRTLFRSIGSGTHDLLYQQFLPLLPSILQQLNRLQNGLHRQPIHELFVELCLTIPVRLSSLLPYLPLLMDPLVCALNGSPNLLQQGLRTLELCVDNLQPEYHIRDQFFYSQGTKDQFLNQEIEDQFSDRFSILWGSEVDPQIGSVTVYEHMMPVRAALMKGLWRIISTSDSQSALSALRILGKFGGSNRKVLLDAQTVEYQTTENGTDSPLLALSWCSAEQPTMADPEQQQQRRRGTFSIREAIQSAVSVLRNHSGDAQSATSSSSSTSANLKVQATELIKCVLLMCVRSDSAPPLIRTVLAGAIKDLQGQSNFSRFLCTEQPSRDLIISALGGLFIGVYNTDTRVQVLPFFKSLTKHLTVMAILESNNATQSNLAKMTNCLDSLVMIDAIVVTLGDSCKDYCHTAVVALRFMMETAAALFDGDRERACQLPMFDYLLERVISLCYRREWFCRLGGCTALRMIIEQYPSSFVHRKATPILDACVEIIFGLSDELSSGAIDFASKTLDYLIGVCFPVNGPINEALLGKFVTYLVNFLGDSEQILRKECTRMLRSISDRTHIPLAQLLGHCEGDLQRNFRANMQEFCSKSVDGKLALIELFLFYANCDQFGMELSQAHLDTFAHNLLAICRAADNAQLQHILGLSQQSTATTSATTANESIQNEVVDEKKMQLIKLTSIDALIMLHIKTVTKQFCNPKNEEDQMIDNGDDPFNDLDLRGPHYLSEIVEYLVDCALNSEHEQNRNIATEGIKRILCEQHQDTSFIDLRLDEFIDGFRAKKEFISTRFFDKLLFLTSHATVKISPTDLQMINNDLSLIMQTSATSLNRNDIDCVAKALELTHAVDFKDEKLLKMAIDFFANCIFIYPTELQNAWIASIHPYMSKLSGDFAEIFLSKKLLAEQNSFRFLMALIEVETAVEFRISLLRNLNIIKPFIYELVSSDPPPHDASSASSSSFELHLLKLLSALVARDLEWEFDDDIMDDIFCAIRSLWCSEFFKNRHSVRKPLIAEMAAEEIDGGSGATTSTTVTANAAEILDERKLDSPAACGQILLAKLRSMLDAIQLGKLDTHAGTNPLVAESVDLIYDLIFAFDHLYASDFAFLRHFIDEELIPKVSLAWRRAAFAKVISLLKGVPGSGHSSQLVRFMQYIVAPAFAYAFEMNDADAVVTAPPPTTDASEQQHPPEECSNSGNIVLLLCKEVIQRLTSERTLVSDSLTIVMYLFCSLLVQKCSLHIYDPAKKQQGNRQEQGNLRHFMLFGWPCLQQSFQGDITEKYAGHFLIANIIDKFSINRTIILQVLNSLIQAHHHDNKDLVRKSLEILIPAVPRRMPDGYLQLQTLLKKVMVEEGRNTAQLIHCLQIIIRHHKVFYNIRHQIAQLVLSALHRLFSLQLNFDTKRLMLEMCEVVIKWEQDRQQAVEEEAERQKSAETQQTTAEEGAESKEPSPTTTSTSDAPSLTSGTGIVASPSSSSIATDVHKQMDKQFIDNIIMFLFRIATSTEPYSPGSSSSSSSGMEQINRRAVLLLRSALKPNVFGGIATIRTNILEKQLHLPNAEQFSAGNEQAINHQLNQVQVTLDVLTNLTHQLMPQMILDIFRPLQRALIACISYTNSQQILRSTYNVFSKLLEKTKCSGTGLDELESLNQHIVRVIHDSLGNYAGTLTPSPPMTTITLLRLMHSAQPSFLETICLTPFIKLLQRLVREYVVCTPGAAGTIDQAQKLISDLLAICLEMLCTRVKFFSMDSQRTVIQLVLLPLIEKSAVDKILENIIKISQEVMATECQFLEQHRQSPQLITAKFQQSQGAHVLLKLFAGLDERVSKNPELHRLFLHAIIQLYEQEQLLGLRLDKLQPAFCWGLCSADRELRNRFFAVFEKRFPKSAVHRLVHIMADEDWQQLGRYHWLAHVVHLLLLSGDGTNNWHVELKSCATIGNTLAHHVAQQQEKQKGRNSEEQTQKEGETMEQEERDGKEGEEERMETDQTTKDDEKEEGAEQQRKKDYEGEEGADEKQREEEDEGIEKQSDADKTPEGILQSKVASMRISFSEATTSTNSGGEGKSREQHAGTMFETQIGLLCLANEMTPNQLVASLVDLLHIDILLCRKIFVELFCSLWSAFTLEEREQLEQLITPFLSSAVHLCQRDSPFAMVAAFLEAFVRCSPPIHLDPFILSYVGSTYNCWHLALLQLEQMAKGIKLASDPILLNINPPDQISEKLELLESLGSLYQQLNELDQFGAVWKRQAYFDKTVKCLALYQQGEFHRCREMAEKLMTQLAEKLSKPALPSSADQAQINSKSISTAIQGEQRVWEQCWINSCKQLNDWNLLENFANSEEIGDAPLLMEAAWHLHDWRLLKDSLVQADALENPRTAIRASLLKIMLNVSTFDEQEYRLSKELMEHQTQEFHRSLVAEWRRLPSIVSHCHIDILNQSHLMHEVSESGNLLCTHLPAWRSNGNTNNNHGLNNAVKHLMKTWRSRPLTTVDQNLAWFDLFNWRNQFFADILRFFEAQMDPSNASFSLPIHTIAQSQLQLARALRHSNQLDLAQAELNKLHSSVLVHPVDAQQKLDEHVKCLLKLSAGGDSTSTSSSSTSSLTSTSAAKKVTTMTAQDALVAALEIVEGTQLQFLKRDQVARLMTNKGVLLSRMDKREEAGRAFSAAAQLDEMTTVLAPYSSAWKHWGDFLTNLYLANHTESSTLTTGIQAIACTLESARMALPQKSRAPIAKLLWLLKITSACPSEKVATAVDQLVAKYVESIAPANWLFWLNQLVSDVQQRRTGNAMVEVLKRVGQAYPQQLFYALRMELGPRSIGEYIEKFTKAHRLLSNFEQKMEVDGDGGDDPVTVSDGKLFKVLDSLLNRHLTDLWTLNRMLNELDNFPIGPIEATLNQFRQILSVCHFDQFTKIAELTTTPMDAQLLKRLTGWLNTVVTPNANADSTSEEGQLFTALLDDFQLCLGQSNMVPLHKVASLLRKWIPRLCENLRKTLGKKDKKLVDSSTFLGRFNSKMAQIDLFAGHLGLGASPYNNNTTTQLSQFIPMYEEVVRNDGATVYRLLRVRALNGKVYSYQLERIRHDHHNNSNNGMAPRAASHIFQLFALLNTEFTKCRNTAQRFVQFALPHFLFTGDNARLMGCTPLAGISSQLQNANADFSAQNLAMFTDILGQMLCKDLSPLGVVDHYYARLAEQRYSHKTIHELFNQISGMKNDSSGTNGNSSSAMVVPKDLLSRWMSSKYTDAPTIWTVRKKLAIHFAILGLCEHAFFLSSMSPDGLVLDLSTAQLFFTDYKFDLTKKVCETITGKVPFIELDANRPVPFRLTPNISHFLGLSVDGHLLGALTAAARALNARTLEVWLRPILWDVFARVAEEDPQLNIVNPVKRAVDTILGRIKTISQIDTGGSNQQTGQQLLIQHSQLSDNLCRMDPSWHPWF